jgi:hypothetical protein
VGTKTSLKLGNFLKLNKMLKLIIWLTTILASPASTMVRDLNHHPEVVGLRKVTDISNRTFLQKSLKIILFNWLVSFSLQAKPSLIKPGIFIIFCK